MIELSKHTETIQTNRLKLKVIEQTDANGILAVRSNKEGMKYMGSPLLKNLAEAEKWVELCEGELKDNFGITWIIAERSRVREQTKYPGVFLAEALSEQEGFCGYVTLRKIDHHNNFAELGYALLPEHFQKGIMTEALSAVLAFGFDTLGLHRLEANLDKHNLPSEKLVQKLGFQREALLRENYLFEGEYLDSLIYGLLESEYRVNNYNF